MALALVTIQNGRLPIYKAYKPSDFFLVSPLLKRTNMPLVHNTVYTIRNDLTHTVLDFGDLTAGSVSGTTTWIVSISTSANSSIAS